MDKANRRLAGILAADVVGYSAMVGTDEPATLARVRTLRTDLIEPLATSHGGRLFKTTGDGFLAAFASAVQALRCAIAIQERLRSEPDGLRLRMGVHQGEVVAEGDDLLGDGVIIAARLEPLAEPGGICISARVREDAAGKIALEVDDLGTPELKNIAHRHRVFRVRIDAPERPALALPDKPSIAVLPFQSMSGDPAQEVFADGMVEDITTALSKIRWFFVIARNSSFTYKGRSVDVKQVGRQLGVRYVLEGSVRMHGRRLRMTAQLVEAETGAHIWAERYDRDLADIFAVQDEITERVVATTEPELYAAENIRSQRKPPESLDAWECVIRALSSIGQGTREATLEAEGLCRRAIAIAPSYGQAHSLLAWVLLRRSLWMGDLQTMAATIRAEMQLALSLDDRDPWAYFAQGNLFFRLRRPDEATLALRRALELNPNFALAHAFLATALAYQRTKEAVESAERALRLSPIDRNVATYASFALAVVRFDAARYQESVAYGRNVIDKSPEWIPGRGLLVAALAMAGKLDAALEERDVLLQLRPGYSLTWVSENQPVTGEHFRRLSEGLRKAGIPEA